MRYLPIPWIFKAHHAVFGGVSKHAGGYTPPRNLQDRKARRRAIAKRSRREQWN